MYSPITNLAGVNAEAFDIVVGTSTEVNAGTATHTMSNFVAAIANSYRVLILDGDHTLVRSEDITETDVRIYFQTNARILKAASFTFTLSGARMRIYDGQFSGFSTDDLILSGSGGIATLLDGDLDWFSITGAGTIVVNNDATDGGIAGAGWSVPQSVATITGTNPTYSMGDEHVLIVNTNVAAWDLSTASFDSVLLNVATEDTSPTGIFFKPDGLKMYMIGNVGDNIYQYTLSPAWDLANAAFDSVLYNVGTENNSPKDIFFKPDGLKMYMIGDTGDNIYQYTLTEPWDLSMISFDSVLYNVGTEETQPEAIFFKPDGLKMYIAGASSNIYQYTLLPAWDLSSASFDSVLLDVSTEGSFPKGIFFKPDGLKMYSGAIDANIYQYTLSPAWDLSSALFDSVLFDVGTEDVNPVGIFFKPDGTKMYMVGDQNNLVFQYPIPYPLVITLPSALGNKKLINIKNIQTENFTIIPQSGELIDNSTQLDITTQYQNISLESDGTDWWII